MRLSVLPLLLMCGCGPIGGTFGMSVTSPVAVGAFASAHVSSSTTVRVGLTQQSRSEREVTILSSAMEPADAWEKLECPACSGSVRYRALRENTGTITVTADDGAGAETFVKQIEAVMPTAVKLFVTPCETMTWQAGVDFELYLQVLSGARVLGDNGLELAPFAVTGGATLEGVPSALRVKTAGASGVGRITSTLDPSFAVPFTVFSPAEVSAIDLVPYRSTGPLTLTAGRPATVGVTITHPGAPACEDKLIRRVATLTPDVCEPLGTSVTKDNDGGYFITLRTKQPGTCTVTASVEGTPATMTRDLTVVAPADVGSPDAGSP